MRRCSRPELCDCGVARDIASPDPVLEVDPAAELPACISVVDGRMNITGPSGERIVESENFFQGISYIDI